MSSTNTNKKGLTSNAKNSVENKTTGKNSKSNDVKQEKESGKIQAIIDLINSVKNLQGKIACNDMDGKLYVRGAVSWNSDEEVRPLDDIDRAYLARFVQNEMGYADAASMRNAILILGDMTHFDLIKEEIDMLPKWDGVERAGHLMSWFLGCDDSPYQQCVEKLLFNALLVRQFEPGAKFDYLPVLIGKQGVGKSTFVRRLALKEDFYTDTLGDIRSREAGLSVQGRIVAEISELTSLKDKDVESIKAFVSRKSDDFRKMHKDDVDHHPRRFCMVGTTNNDHFLKDTTGNRRFLPIQCGIKEADLDIFDDACDEFFKQAWAETLYHYRKEGSLPLVLPHEVEADALAAQCEAEMDDPRVGLISDWLDEQAERHPNYYICAAEIIREVLGYEKDYPKGLPNEIHAIMKANFPQWKSLGVKKKNVQGYGVQRVYSFVGKL